MIATVTNVSQDGIIQARVRRAYYCESLQGRHYDLKVGDRVEVVRKTNNPYLVRVQTQPTNTGA